MKALTATRYDGHEEAEDSGFIYYTRYFRARDAGGRPDHRAALVSEMPSFSVLTLPGDNDTWSVTLYVSAGDRPLKALRHPEKWDAVLAACPRHAHWADGEPLTGVLAMGGVVDRHRRMVVAGRPVATGVLPVADAWACTNPSLGRGMTLGLMHVRRLRDFSATTSSTASRVWDTVTEVELTPWYRATVGEDSARRRALEADRVGAVPPAPPDGDTRVRAGLPLAATADPDLFLAHRDPVLPRAARGRVGDPGVAARVLDLSGDVAPPVMGPDRAGLLALLS